jgi:hypothetical protein
MRTPRGLDLEITVTPISRPVVKGRKPLFWQRQLPKSSLDICFQLPRSNRARFFG